MKIDIIHIMDRSFGNHYTKYSILQIGGTDIVHQDMLYQDAHFLRLGSSELHKGNMETFTTYRTLWGVD